MKTYGDQFNAFLLELLRGRLRGIASDVTNLELLRELCIVQEAGDEGTTLVARGIKDCDDLDMLAG